MKYIRLKDGRIFDEEGWKQEVEYINKFYPNTYIESLIYKQADTIDELCDCYVDYCKEDNSHLISNEKPTCRNGHEIYGAIWAINGLMYVAKMNKKGEITW